MKTIVFSLLAMFGYAMGNVLLEQKLSKFNNLTLIMCYSFTVLVISTVTRHFIKTDDPSFAFPAGWSILPVFMLGLIFFVADYFYIGAYTTGGNLLTIASIVVMFPVFASLLRFIWTQEVPNVYHIGGYLLAAVAVVLVTKGNMLLTPK